MKNIIILILLLSVHFFTSHAQTNVKRSDVSSSKINANSILSSGVSGCEYIIAIPVNDIDMSPAEYINIYIASAYNTVVKFKDNLANDSATFSITAYKVTTIARSVADEIKYVSEFEKVINKTFTLSSSQAFTVYVINRKSISTDGYLAIPTVAWGTKYIHLCNYDNPEGNGSQGFSMGSGFVVLAKSNNTHIKIRLVDQMNKNVYPYFGLGRTIAGRKGGDSITVTLNAGQAYAIQGNGAGPGSGGAIGYLDLSGSEIESDSLIGLISYHNRTDIPVNAYDNTSYMVEMIPPISSWGTQILSQEFNRNDFGDLFRVIASENNTTIHIRWFSKTSGANLNDINVLLNKGDIWEYENNSSQTGSIKGVRGLSIIEANKPILANQYAYSSNWEEADDYMFPFMITQPPTKIYVSKSMFSSGGNFSANYLNFIAYGYMPEDDQNPKFFNPSTSQPYTPYEINNMKLSSLYFGADSASLSPISSISTQRIPCTGGYRTTANDTIGGLYWGTISLQDGAYIMESKKALTTFGGYVYGYESGNSYGWPIDVYSFRTLKSIDESAPKRIIQTTNDSVTWNIKYADSLNYQIDDSTNLIDVGLASIYLVKTKNTIDNKAWSFNVALIDSMGSFLDSIPTNSATYSFKLKILDTTKSARALIKIVDKNYNYALDTIYSYYINYIDKIEPKIESKSTSDSLLWNYNCSDSLYYQVNDTTFQKDRGLSKIYAMGKQNFNLLDSDGFAVDTIRTTSRYYNFHLLVINRLNDAKAIIAISDKNNNIRIDSVFRYKRTRDTISIIDILPPKNIITKQNGTGLWSLTYADTTSYKINDTLMQRDQGIAKIFLKANNNFELLNYSGSIVDSILTDESIYTLGLRVVDTTKNGSVRLRVQDKNGNCADTIINYSNPLGIIGAELSNTLIVSPNPVGELLRITVNSNLIGDYELSLYNLIGDKIRILSNGTLTGNAKSLEFATDGISAGSYYIRLKIGESTETQKIIINK